MNHKQILQTRLRNNTANIGIIGLGYIGLPLSFCFTEAGYKVIGFDIDPAKTRQLNNGTSYIHHFGDEKVRAARQSGFEATTDFSRTRQADVLIICVPTPLMQQRIPDISFVTNTVDSILPYLHKGQIVSLESTTYPGTTEEELKPRIESSGFSVGKDIYLVYSPEREDPGNMNFTTRTIPKVVGGSTATCLEMGLALYGKVIDTVVAVSSTRVAEMSKLLENIHRAVNIGLINEMKVVADKMGINIYEVIDAAATKPFGFVPYDPGPGLGGHCIPVDPFYLTWKAKQYGVHTRFIELAGEVNSNMPAYVVGKIAQALQRHGKAIHGSRILMLGIAYKKNVDDMRESPSVEIMSQLRSKSALVDYSDPLVPRFPAMRNYDFDLQSIELTPTSIQQYDCVVIGTNHDAFDYPMIAEYAQVLVDTRGVFREEQEHIILG